MKWLGQYIQDLTARFRDDVYLENISSGTIASGGNLGLDSNNKIVKATEASGDITGVSITTDSGGGSKAEDTGGSADFSILGTSGVGVTNSGTTITATSVPGEIDHDSLLNFAANEHFTQANITTVGTIGTGVWQGTAIASTYLDADTAHLSGTQTFDGIKSFGQIISAVFDGDKDINPGDGAVIHVDSHDVTDATTSASETAAMYTHVNIENPRLLATNSSITTSDAATLYIKGAPVASTNQTISRAWSMWVGDGNARFDGSIYSGTAEVINSAGIIQIASQPSITTLAGVSAIGSAGTDITITSDTVNFTSANADDPAIWIKNTANDDQATRMLFLKDRGADGQDGDECGAIYFYSFDDGTPSLQKYGYIESTIHDATSGQESGKLDIGVANHDGGAEPGVSMQGGSEDGEVDVTIASGVNSSTTIAGDLSVLGDSISASSATSAAPSWTLQNTTDNAESAQIAFVKQRLDGSVQAGEDDDRLGRIVFNSYNDAGTPENKTYARIESNIHDATDGEESGQLTFAVINHDGGMGDGLTLTGGSANNEIDVTLGLGTASVTTIAGDLDVTGNIVGGHLMHYRFMGYSTGDGTNYEMGQQMTDGQAPFEHADTSSSDGLTIPGASGTNVSEMIRMGGYVMPNAATLKKWTGWVSYNDNGNDCYIALFKWSPVENDTTDISASHGGLTLLDEATVAGKANDKVMPLSETGFASASVAAGDIIFTQVKTSTSGKIVYFNTTLEVEF